MELFPERLIYEDPVVVAFWPHRDESDDCEAH